MHHKHHEHHQHVALAVFATFALTAIIVGVLVFAYQERQFESRQLATQEHIGAAGDVVKELQDEKKDLEKKVEDLTAAVEQLSTVSAGGTTGGVELPLVRFSAPGKFTQAEKDELWEKLFNPYMAYYNLLENEDPVVTIMVEKYDDSDNFQFGVDAIHQTGTAGFVFGDKGEPLEFWHPTCMGPCAYPDIFKTKYPELVREEAS